MKAAGKSFSSAEPAGDVIAQAAGRTRPERADNRFRFRPENHNRIPLEKPRIP
jgi:hypothetical protein